MNCGLSQQRIVQNFNEKVVIVFTEKTSNLTKEAIHKAMKETIPNHESSIYIWDSAVQESTQTTFDKIKLYESIIQKSNRVILTADLDYACAHAISKGKPTYIAFSGRCRSYLTQFYRWVSDAHLIRKLRLGKGKHKSTNVDDPYSYLGIHPDWGNGNKIFQYNHTMSFIKKAILQSRQETLTGKRKE
ncbi:hypothetical protein BDF20DRAFT_419037 [Mycotypha africana]|uniref:uncharacterized protein n=1 Tax=Mycotypha africana TaxID=64632 RepID=UPI002301CD46|nr:uncharacterized protein BDF20DRAFT_419037 [Mycotypha africana]KAI8981662.1 hypothetical protein BDF20DRAFT_419037 [Mycotypha africana]